MRASLTNRVLVFTSNGLRKSVVQPDPTSLLNVGIASKRVVDVGVVNPGDVLATGCGDLNAIAGDELLVGKVDRKSVDVVPDVKRRLLEKRRLGRSLCDPAGFGQTHLERLSLLAVDKDLTGSFKRQINSDKFANDQLALVMLAFRSM